MAINIFNSADDKRTRKDRALPVQTSSAATRAAATTQAVGGNAASSNSGSTAVKSNGILSKVGSFVNNVAGKLSYVPGIVGKVAGIVEKLTSKNDPEWWNTIPGDGLTTNQPLQTALFGSVSYNVSGSPSKFRPAGAIRPAILEFESADGSDFTIDFSVILPDDRMVTQYLMPQVRKVTNAVVLQDASAYTKAFKAGCTMYALWRQLKKIDFFLKHGSTFMPSVNFNAFPILLNANAAYLQSTITRLEEYLRANIRLPHTMCEYLGWRFGRTYRSEQSAKAPFVMYNVVPITRSIDSYEEAINHLMGVISADPAVQKANTDIYNAYLDHDQEVYLSDDTQCTYDPKEFCLRTNLDIITIQGNQPSTIYERAEPFVLMDSNLDNPTTFMASTVSTSTDQAGVIHFPLFPVLHASAYFYDAAIMDNDATAAAPRYSGDVIALIISNTINSVFANRKTENVSKSDEQWFITNLDPFVVSPTTTSDTGAQETIGAMLQVIGRLIVANAVNYHNAGYFVPAVRYDHTDTPLASTSITMIDASQLAQDSGVVTDVIVRNEQVIAFANLVAYEHKDKTTYKLLEKRVAKDVANLVENTEVATIAK